MLATEEQAKIAVIGTVFVDCKGFSEKEFNPAGRNLGDVRFFHGGVGRNVVENLGRMGLNPWFVSMADQSGMGDEVIARLEEAAVDIRHVRRTEALGMGFWLAILDSNGELAGAISQMPDLRELEEYLQRRGADIVTQSTDIVLELDLNSRITRQVVRLAKEARRPVYGIPGNLSVILANKDVLADIDCFICNDIEAAKLFDTRVDRANREGLQRQLKEYVDASGLQSMVITLGGDGSVYYDRRTGDAGYQPVFPVEVVETSGAGDAFFSGTVMGLTRRQPLREAVAWGSRVAAWTIQSTENVRQDLGELLRRQETFR
ncbi:MAG TPA: PfkB family carbohydrate kinase [Patescibacteria group bacterium]|nr:PfkB family carbohydrate kinase [Patescibacteria group bacterium]